MASRPSHSKVHGAAGASGALVLWIQRIAQVHETYLNIQGGKFTQSRVTAIQITRSMKPLFAGRPLPTTIVCGFKYR